jgi:hypothetical protein
LGETLGPLALRRDDLKSAGSSRIAKRECKSSRTGAGSNPTAAVKTGLAALAAD